MKKYKIETVEDFLNIPEDKIDRCLADFRVWHHVASHLATISKSFGGCPTIEFTWVDDNKYEISINIDGLDNDTTQNQS